MKFVCMCSGIRRKEKKAGEAAGGFKVVYFSNLFYLYLVSISFLFIYQNECFDFIDYLATLSLLRYLQ